MTAVVMMTGLLVAVPVTGDTTAVAASVESSAEPVDVAASPDPNDQDPIAEGNYVPLPQALLVDTRSGIGTPQAKLTAGQTRQVQVTGRGGVPTSGVQAIALDVTTVNSTTNSPLTLWPTGQSRPSTTTHTTMAGETLSNIAFVESGTDGKVNVHNVAGETDLLVKVTGYFTDDETGAGFSVLNQARVADTRSGTGVPQGQLPGSYAGSVTVSLTEAGVPSSATSAALTFVVVASANGFLNAGIPGDAAGKNGLNYAPGRNAVTKVVPIKDGKVEINNGGSEGVDLLVDVQGFFGAANSGGGFHTLTGKIYDSRETSAGTIPADGQRTVAVLGRQDLPRRRVGAAMLSLTVTGQTSDGAITAFAEGLAPNAATNLSYEAGQVRTNSLLVPTELPATGKIVIRNFGPSPVHVVIDADGYFDPYFDPEPGAAFPAGPGARGFSAFTDSALTARTTARANAVNGNLLLSTAEVGIAGRGQDLALGRHYNSRTDAGASSAAEAGRSSTDTAETGAFGPGWTLDATGDIRLPAVSVNRVLHGPTGSEVTFTPAGAGWKTPTGMTATLTTVSGGFRLRMDREGETWNFTTDGRLTSRVDRNDNTTTYTTGSDGRLARITDTRGRDLRFTWSTGTTRVITRISDVTGREWDYAYTSGRLTSATDPTGVITRYTYDTAGRLASVADPRGVLAVMTYDTAGRVTSLDRPLTGASGGPTYTMTYADGRTRVVDPNAGTTTYVYDYLGRVNDVYDPLGNDRSTDYDANSNVTSYTPTTGQQTGRGVTNTYSQDGRNNLLSSVAPTGSSTTMTYAATQNPWAPSTVTDAQSSSLTYTYDAK